MLKKKVAALLDLFVRSGAFSALLALSGVAVGAIASVYSVEIKTGGLYRLQFLLVCAVFFVLWMLREWRIGVARSRQQKRLESAQHQLMATIRTMPPQNLLYIYSAIYREISGHINRGVNQADVRDADTLALVDDAIRITLDGMCSLVAAFENYPDGAVYSGNIMQYQSVQSIRSRGETETVLSRLHFTDPKTLDGLAGILDLQLPLSSTSAEDSSSARDRSLQPLALPVPLQALSEVPGKTRVIPGAPMAFSGKPCLVEDSSKLAQIAAEMCDVSPTVIREIETYFHEGASKGIGSWLSMCIVAENPERGVVNIHCDRTNILCDQKQLYTYINLIIPFLDIIDRLLDKRELCLARHEEDKHEKQL